MGNDHDILSDPLLVQAPVISGFKILPPCIIVERLDEGAMGLSTAGTT
jgi:hypothetical protein